MCVATRETQIKNWRQQKVLVTKYPTYYSRHKTNMAIVIKTDKNIPCPI